MKAVGRHIFGAIRDIAVIIELLFSDGDLVADRISARGIRQDTAETITWTENHIYGVVDGKIKELWPSGGPELGRE